MISASKSEARRAADEALERAFVALAALGNKRPSTVELAAHGTHALTLRVIARWAARLTSAAKRGLVLRHQRESATDAHRWEWIGGRDDA